MPAAAPPSCCASAKAAAKFCRTWPPRAVDRETAAAAVEALRPEDAAEAGEDPDLASARALVARQYARKLAEGKTQQVMAALARRGFSHSVIKAAVGEAVEELETGNGE